MARKARIAKKKDRSEFFPSISSAFYEWILIILLYINAIFSYISLKFARYCKLLAPCPLCSRFDFVSDTDPVTFLESLCGAHRSEVGSLVDVASPDDKVRTCYARAYVCGNNAARDDAETKNATRDHGFDMLSHVGYSKVKVNSDSESEFMFTDDEGRADNLKDGLASRNVQLAPAVAIAKNMMRAVSNVGVSEKASQAVPEASVMEVEKKVEEGGLDSSAGVVGEDSKEISSDQVEAKTQAPEILSEEVPRESMIANVVVPEVDLTNGEATKTLDSSDASLKMSQIMNEKLAPVVKPPLPAPVPTDLLTGKELPKVSEDLKARLSQISSSQWSMSDFPWNDPSASPRQYGQTDEPRLSDASSSAGTFNYGKRPSVDRCESGLESLDGSLLGDIEGEPPVDRLKRQIEMDRRSMIVLYKELEEERNASAIAANQAMAMINRLQEEKASMHMEALQYLRMMEEQSEFDQEELQKLNDLLADRDKEIQDLEAEIDSYRIQFGGAFEQARESEERLYKEYTPATTPRFTRSRTREISRNNIGDFEDEKVYISECIKSLEKKLQSISNSKPPADSDTVPEKSSVTENESANGTMENNQKVESVMENYCSTPSSTQPGKSFFKDALKESTVLRSISYNERQMASKRNDATALSNEISLLSARLEALEADRSILSHAVDSLKNGSNGLQFVEEIASHLRELRKIGVTPQQIVA